jgi:TolA-binding protein
MRKFIIFLLIIGGIAFWATNFIRSGDFDKYLDAHPNESIVPPINYGWGLLLSLSSKYEAAINRFNKVIEQYPKSDYAVAAMASINDALYDMNQSAKCVEQGQKFLEQYPNSDRAEIIRRRIQFIQHGY